jgi:hypothetical protein
MKTWREREGGGGRRKREARQRPLFEPFFFDFIERVAGRSAGAPGREKKGVLYAVRSPADTASPIRHHQEMSRSVHYSSHFSAIFSRTGRRARVGARKRWRVKKKSLLFLKISRMARRYINQDGQNHLRIRANANLCVSFIYNTRGPAETANRDGTAFAHSGREPGGRRTPSAMRGGL